MIDHRGEQLGVLDTREAVKKAQEEGYDLVEVGAKENPPVCRIMDLGKYLYDEKKKKRESKKKQTKVEVKECKFRPKIGDHDFDVRIRRAVKFLAKGNKVKLTVMFRGREHAHPEIAEKLILRAFDQIKDLGKMEAHPKKEGRDMHTLVAPLPGPIRAKAMKVRLKAAEDAGEKIDLSDDDTEIEDDNTQEEVVVDEVTEEGNTENETELPPDTENDAVAAEEIT